MNCRVCDKEIDESEAKVQSGCCKTCFEKVKKLHAENEKKKKEVLEIIDIYEEKTSEKLENKDNTEEYKNNKPNKVASKFNALVVIIKICGYLLAIVMLIIGAQEENIVTGIVAGLIIAIFTFFSTIFYEAIAEILNLLEDIKNKL